MTVPSTLVSATHDPLLAVEQLSIGFPDERGQRLTPVVRDAAFTVDRNEIVGLVGESGSGKTQTALAILGLTRPSGRVLGGRVVLNGQVISGMSEEQLRQVRGKTAAMIFQSPRTSLNPLMTAGSQIGRIYRRRQQVNQRAAEQATLEILGRAGVAGPKRIAQSYPHQLSGGMAQRVMIAMMLACGPELLIADEPTTGLDVTIQAQIFDLIKEIQSESQMSVLLITHDLGVVAEVCQRVVVMQLGRVVEIAPVDVLFANPRHPYTRRLLGSIIGPDTQLERVPSQGPLNSAMFEMDGAPYQAVSVDSWMEQRVTRPELITVAAGHWVLAHQLPEMAGATL